MRVSLAHTTSITPGRLSCRSYADFILSSQSQPTYTIGIVFCTNINAQVRQLFFVDLDVKVKENKETPNLLSLLIKCVCEISHVADNYSTKI
jgi:hypothetical protein